MIGLLVQRGGKTLAPETAGGGYGEDEPVCRERREQEAEALDPAAQRILTSHKLSRCAPVRTM